MHGAAVLVFAPPSAREAFRGLDGGFSLVVPSAAVTLNET
jgi:hypothetical protein